MRARPAVPAPKGRRIVRLGPVGHGGGPTTARFGHVGRGSGRSSPRAVGGQFRGTQPGGTQPGGTQPGGTQPATAPAAPAAAEHGPVTPTARSGPAKDRPKAPAPPPPPRWRRYLIPLGLLLTALLLFLPRMSAT